jgi:hypothetical protein
MVARRRRGGHLKERRCSRELRCLLIELVPLDVDVRQGALYPVRQLPGRALEDGGRDDRHADHEGVDQDAEGEGEAEALCGGVRDRSGRDDFGAVGVAVAQGLAGAWAGSLWWVTRSG